MPVAWPRSKPRTRNCASWWNSKKKVAALLDLSLAEDPERLSLIAEAGATTGLGRACAAVGYSRARFYRERRARTKTAPEPVLLSKPNGVRRAAFRKRNAPFCSTCCSRSALWMLRRARCMRNCCKKACITLRTAPCTACCTNIRPCVSGARCADIRSIPKPELKAMGPNQVWTWDITYLKTPVRGRFYYLYVVINIYSRYVVGWTELAERECALLAHKLLQETCRKYHIVPNQLTIHADRGAPMKSQSVAQLLLSLQVTRSHSRPRVSNDNPYSEAGFKTLKYSAHFPERFGTQEDAQTFCQDYFVGYNTRHHHTALVLLTPEQVHFGEAAKVLAQRQVTLDAAYAAHPQRFGERPQAGKLPDVVWINAPALPVGEGTAPVAV